MKIAYSKLFSLFLIFSFALGIFNVPGVLAYPDTISAYGTTSHTTGSLGGREASFSIGTSNYILSLGIDGGSITILKYTDTGVYSAVYTQAVGVDDHVTCSVYEYDSNEVIIFVAGEKTGSNTYMRVEAFRFDGSIFNVYGTAQDINCVSSLQWVAISDIDGGLSDGFFVVACGGINTVGVKYYLADLSHNTNVALAVSLSVDAWHGLPQVYCYDEDDNKIHIFMKDYMGYYNPSTGVITEQKEDTATSYTNVDDTCPFDEDTPYGVILWDWAGLTIGGAYTGLTAHQRWFEVYEKGGINYVTSCYYEYSGTGVTGTITNALDTHTGMGIVEIGSSNFQNIVTFVTVASNVYLQYSYNLDEMTATIEDINYYSLGGVETSVTDAYAFRWGSATIGNLGSLNPFCENWYTRGDMDSVDGSSNYEIIFCEKLYALTEGQDYGELDTTLSITALTANDTTAFWMMKQAAPTTSDYALAEIAFAVNQTDSDLNVGVYVTASHAVPSGTNNAYKIAEWYFEAADVNGSRVVKKVNYPEVLGHYVVLYVVPETADANITWATAVSGSAGTGATTIYFDTPITELPTFSTGSYNNYTSINMTDYPEGLYFYLCYEDLDISDDDAGISSDSFVFTYDTTVYDITGGTSTGIATGFYAMADEIGIDRSAFGILLTLICFFAMWFISSAWSKEMPQNLFFVILLFAGSASMWAFIGVLPISVWVGFMAIVALLLFSKLREV